MKVDLITGFLGSGKTTFLKKYVGNMLRHGLRPGVLENDYGAVNVDTMLLGELARQGCMIESVAGACDRDCHARRFKTKLIAMGMSGLDRVIIEPSGIFDVDEFFDALREEPLDRWYEIGSVIAVVDASEELPRSEASEFFLASQIAGAGAIVFSKTAGVPKQRISAKIDELNSALRSVGCERMPELVLAKSWDELCDSDFEEIMNCGYYPADYVKKFSEHSGYGSVYFMNRDFSTDELRSRSEKLFDDEACGEVLRVKGFARGKNGRCEFNATKNDVRVEPVSAAQDIVIVIGENLNEDRISEILCPKDEENNGDTA